MAFENTDLEAVYNEIDRRRTEAGRLSLVEFDETEYAVLLRLAKEIIRSYRWRWYSRREQVRLVFLAFTMAFVRRHKYTSDNVFWPGFEAELDLAPMTQRVYLDDLLWQAYQEEELELKLDGRGRSIVATLTNELQQATDWVTHAPRQFVDFFKWYYRHHPHEPISSSLIEVYQKKTGRSFTVLDKVLPVLSRDCRALAQVIDYAVEHSLYLDRDSLDEYRREVIAALGLDYDPSRLRLIKDERTLILLILELQNHRTPVQFERELREKRGDIVVAPWGDRANIQTALERWPPFPYGIYHVGSQEYRVVPHSKLRLEIMGDWPLDQIVVWQGERYLAYKKQSPFQVTIGRRTIEARAYWQSSVSRFYIWVGQVPIGEKLLVDGQLCTESAGADWRLGLKLSYKANERPSLCVAIDRLVLYYPQFSHYPVEISATNNFHYSDTLREDGVRRFHRHGALVIPLESFDTPLEIGVTVGDKTILHQTFTPDPALLFSVSGRERVQAREQADIGDREYMLFTRSPSPPKGSAGLEISRLSETYGAYTLYHIVWEDASHPFELKVGDTQWAFHRRREFSAFFGSKPPSSSYLRLKSHQVHRFRDSSLRLYSTFDPLVTPLTLEVWDDGGLLIQFDLADYVSPSATPQLYDIDETLWQELDRLAPERWGRYLLLFKQNDSTLAEIHLSLLPPLRFDWDSEAVYLEEETLRITVRSPHPLWSPAAGQPETRLQLSIRPKSQAEIWPEQPGLRRLVSEAVSTSLTFPDLGESVDVVVQPRLFGFRLYLKHTQRTFSGQWKSVYQPLAQADYYQLNRTVLYLFSAPEAYVEIRCGARLVWTGHTDANGDLLITDLSFLSETCLDEQSHFTIRSENRQTRFVVKWAPVLYEMRLEDQALFVRYQGPENTGLRLQFHNVRGEISHTWNLACRGDETTEILPLPTEDIGPGYLTVQYVLSDGQTRPAAQQLQVGRIEAPPLLLEWLEEGIGIADEQDLLLLRSLTG